MASTGQKMPAAGRKRTGAGPDFDPVGALAVAEYKAELWRMADALRGSMDAAEYKHVVLGLIFLKYISDAFEEVHAQLEAERDDGADPEDPDEYRALNVFWVPRAARWSTLQAQVRQAGRGASSIYTPRSVVRLLVEMPEPYRGRVYDPCCGSSGMFAQRSSSSGRMLAATGTGQFAPGESSLEEGK